MSGGVWRCPHTWRVTATGSPSHSPATPSARVTDAIVLISEPAPICERTHNNHVSRRFTAAQHTCQLRQLRR